MKQIIKELSELAGKTIDRAEFIEYESQIWIMFTDDTFVILETEYESSSVSIDYEMPSILAENANLLKMEIVTDEEVAAAREAYRAAQEETVRIRAAQVERNERAEFERLKAKFEGAKV